MRSLGMVRRLGRILHRRFAPIERAEPSTPSGVIVVIMAAWFGCAAGLLELGGVLAWHALGEGNVLGTLQLNRHFPWMIPTAQVVIFLTAFLPMVVLTLFRPRLAVRCAVYGGVAFVGFSLLSVVAGLYAGASALLAAGLAIRIGRHLEGRMECFARFTRRTLPGFGLAIAGLGVWSFDREVLHERRTMAALPPAAKDAPNVLLIVLDTVTAGHLSLHGYGRPTSPNLERMARRGVIFDEARAPSPWTLPSHATLLTGRWPHELKVGVEHPLDASWPTLAEYLRKHGYATSGFIANTYFCNSWFGLGRGFVRYEDYYEGNVLISPMETLRSAALGRWLIRKVGAPYGLRPETVNQRKDADRINADFLEWLDANRGRPFFTFLNYFDAHDPYEPAPGGSRRFGSGPLEPEDHELIWTWSKHIQTCARTSDVGASPREQEFVRDSYDDCLAHLDEALGRLFDELDRRGRLDETLVVLTADHGEAFGEHGFWGHSMSLHREELHVPLVMFGPRVAAGVRVAQPVSLRDVPATIVERLGLWDGSPIPGSSLAAGWGAAPGSVGPVLSTVELVRRGEIKGPVKGRAPAFHGPMASIVIDGHTYIRDAFGREQLFELSEDPGERIDCSGDPAMAEMISRCRMAIDQLVPLTEFPAAKAGESRPRAASAEVETRPSSFQPRAL